MISKIESVDGPIVTPKAPVLPGPVKLDEDTEFRVLAGLQPLTESMLAEKKDSKADAEVKEDWPGTPEYKAKHGTDKERHAAKFGSDPELEKEYEEKKKKGGYGRLGPSGSESDSEASKKSRKSKKDESLDPKFLAKFESMVEAKKKDIKGKKAEEKMDEGGASMPGNQYLSIPADKTKLSIGQRMARDGITYSGDNEREMIGQIAKYMKDQGESSRTIRYYMNDDDFVADTLSDLRSASMESQQGMAEGSKPDFLDVDKDGDKKEPMKKAAKEAKKDDDKKDGKKGMTAKQAKYFGKKKTNESQVDEFFYFDGPGSSSKKDRDHGEDELARREKKGIKATDPDYKQKDDPRYGGRYKVAGPKGKLPESQRGSKKTVKESFEPKMSFRDMMKLVVESGGQQQIDPLDKALFAWATRIAKNKLGEGTKGEVYAGLVYERMGGLFEMYDVLSEDQK